MKIYQRQTILLMISVRKLIWNLIESNQLSTTVAADKSDMTSEAGCTRKPSYRWQTRATRKSAKIAPIRRAYCTTLSLTILAYLHSFSCCCVRNLRNPAKFTKNSNLWSSRSSKVIDLGVNGKPICDFILVINSNFSRICYRFQDIHG